ncbi:NAD-P-binding protein [Stereum hirsutum FP-91666 SS1]|uniref:NAD-P-binding protein n=1 Tax=Stereum hirsutum (strain FP-91666) TaxID=721885 RepID=R7RWC8_STEHR|nr:NAD-P-binding protein [Stereum hirsutum FP-91666 SS1]EIM79661.1 NAD-P-binding protein [Stereum hirsutum FP-91666 SS1]
MGQLWSSTFPPSPKWSVKDIPDLSGKVMIVTGGNSGIGKEIIRALLTHDAKVYLAARNAESAKATIVELKNDTGKEPIFLSLDLSSLKSVKMAAEEFMSKERKLDTLFNNGGVMFLTSAPQADAISEDGYDIQWATNALGPWYFTHLLTPALIIAAETSQDTKARILFTSSIVQGKDLNWDAMKDTPARRKMSADARYGQSKLANTVMSREMARRYGDKGIVSMSLNPGGIKTGLQRHMPAPFRFLLNLIMYPASMGALTPLWGGTSPEGADLNGKFLVPWGRVGIMHPAAENSELGRKLWTYLEEQVKEIMD